MRCVDTLLHSRLRQSPSAGRRRTSARVACRYWCLAAAVRPLFCLQLANDGDDNEVGRMGGTSRVRQRSLLAVHAKAHKNT